MSGYSNVKGVCVEGNIENCTEYYETSQDTFKCLKCKAGYFPEGNNCEKTAIKNCVTFETRKKCKICEDGYQLVDTVTGESYCIKIPDDLNCK